MPDPDPSSGSYLIQIVFLFVLILINAFFSMAEMATVSVNNSKVKNLAEDGNKRAKRLYGLLLTPNKFLSTIQVCITLAGFLQSASAATAMSGDLGRIFDNIGLPCSVEIAVVVITLILAYFNLVLGELVPKRIALQHPERIALVTSGAVWFVSRIFAPFVWFLSKSVSVILRPFGIKSDRIEEVYSEEEIKSHLDVGISSGEIDEAGADMIASVFEFDDKLAYEIMTPRTDVYMKSIHEPLADYVNDMIKTRYSRIPYFDKDNDDIIGVLYMKDFYIKAMNTGFGKVGIKKLLRKPYFVPESKNIDDLFREMQERKEHMSFLVDEYGGLSGIVTIEDMVEEVMGNIDDEYDDDEPKIEQIDTQTYEMDGGYYIDDLNEALEDAGIEGIRLLSDDYETVGGLLIDALGEIPDDGVIEQTIKIGRCLFTIKSWKERRIERIRLEILPEETTGDEEDRPEEESADKEVE
jgi:putative hemolysin